MDVPVEAGALGEGRVGARDEEGGEVGRAVGCEEGVEGAGEEGFVDVEGEGWEAEAGAEGADEVGEEGWGGEGEGVVHFDDFC